MKKILNFIKKYGRELLLFLLTKIGHEMQVTIKNKQGKVFNIKDYLDLSGTDFTSTAVAEKLRNKSGRIKKRILNRVADRGEVIDTGADLYQVFYIIIMALSDGFDLTDIIIAIGQESAIREIINDAPIAWKGLADHKIMESQELVQDLLEEVESRVGEVSGVGVQIFNALWVASSTAEFVANTIGQAEGLVDQAKEVPGTKLLVPRKAA